MKVLKQVKSLAVCALVACGAVVSAQATWHHVGSQLQSDSGWKINVNTSEAGPLTINNDCHVAHPETPDYIESNGTETYLLDLSEPIDDGSYIVGTGAFSFRRDGFPYLHKIVFPDTLKEIPGGAATLFGGQSYLKEISPTFPISFASYGNRIFDIGGTDIRQDLFFLNDAFASLPKQGINGWKGTNVYFGVGMTSFGDYLFQGRGNPTRFYFFGDYPTSYGGNFTSQQGCKDNGMLLCYPKGNASWEAFLAANARTPTASEISSTQAYYPGVTPTAIVTNGVWKSIGNKARVVAWDPWDEKDWFVVKGSEGSVATGSNIVKPEYGPQLRSTLSDSVVCVAPTEKQTYKGLDYNLAGYKLEKYAGDGVWTEVASGTENTYTFANSTVGSGTYRLVWQWEGDDKVALTVAIPTPAETAGVIGEIQYSPANTGLYKIGTEVTVTAVIADDWKDGASFGFWEGDVPAGHESDNPLVITMDRAKTIKPYVKAPWRAVDGYATTRITDGYWTLKCSTAAESGKISISGDSIVTQGDISILDLQKPVLDGRKITAVGDHAFRYADSRFKTFIFPNELESIVDGAAPIFNGSVTTLLNTFPNSLASLPGNKSIGGVVHGFKTDGPIKLLNKNLTTFPSQFFYGQDGGHTYHLGVGFTRLSDYAFDGGGGSISVYFYGDTKVTVGGSWTRGVGPIRFVVPKTSADWKAWIAAGNVTPATDSSRATYNSTFPNQEPGEKFIGVCKNVDGLNGVYLCTWPSPAAKQFKILLR